MWFVASTVLAQIRPDEATTYVSLPCYSTECHKTFVQFVQLILVFALQLEDQHFTTQASCTTTDRPPLTVVLDLVQSGRVAHSCASNTGYYGVATEEFELLSQLTANTSITSTALDA